MRFGLFCSTKDSIFSTNRSFKLASLSKEKVLETVKKNLQDFELLMAFCEEKNIVMFRLGNAIVPFASHLSFEEVWWDELEPLFLSAKKANEKRHIRLTIHPGQFIQLGSPNLSVVEASLRELRSCFRFLDLLDAGKNGVVTLHVGGAHGDKNATMERFYDVFSHNQWLLKYLALENDEYNFNAHETLSLANRCGIPMIFDIFHHSINPSNISWKEIEKSWGTKRPKIHISSQGEGKKGMHAPFIDKMDFENLKNFIGHNLFEVDVMVEAKAKEEAIAMLTTL